MQDLIITARLRLEPIPRETARALSENQAQETTDFSYLKKAIEEHPEIIADTKELRRVLDVMGSMYDKDELCYGAFLNDELVGFVNLVHPDGDFPILQYEVKEDYHRKGLGYEAITGYLRAYWEAYHSSSVFALIRPNNTASIALIKKLSGILVPPKSLLEELMFSTYKVAPLKQ